MIGVSARPWSSSAARSAPTRPSIMSLGATTSAPASAWDTAVRASSSSVRSLSTSPSSRSTPQWPWLVYSHRHRSVMTSRSGCSALIARVASCTIPSSSHAPEPSSSFVAGQAEQQHRGDTRAQRPRPPRRRRPRRTSGRSPACWRSARGRRGRAARTSDRRGAPARAPSRAPARAAAPVLRRRRMRVAGNTCGSLEPSVLRQAQRFT